MRRVRIQGRRAVAHPLGPDLQQHLRPVVGPFLYHPVRVARDPDVVHLVREAAVDAVRQHRGRAVGRQRGVAPARGDVAGRVVQKYRRRGNRLRPLLRQQAVGQKAPVDGDDVVVGVDTACADHSGHPLSRQPVVVRDGRQGFGPERIDPVGRGLRSVLRRRQGHPERAAEQDCQKADRRQSACEARGTAGSFLHGRFLYHLRRVAASSIRRRPSVERAMRDLDADC